MSDTSIIVTQQPVSQIITSTGIQGPPGRTGKSTYDLALENGFVGTIIDYLQSLVGENGKSAYQLALQEGFVGTLAEYLTSLRGEIGKSAYQLALDQGYVGTLSEWMELNRVIVHPEDAGKFMSNDGTIHYWTTITKDTVGLSRVDNTSDLEKPISNATALELDKKLNKLELESEINKLTIDQGFL